MKYPIENEIKAAKIRENPKNNKMADDRIPGNNNNTAGNNNDNIGNNNNNTFFDLPQQDF